MGLMRRIRIKIVYRFFRSTDTSSYHPTVIPETNDIPSCIVDLTMLWHQRLGHIGKKGICAMYSKGIIKGIPNYSSKFNFCEHYVYGKQDRVSFPTKATREKRILELVHMMCLDLFRSHHSKDLNTMFTSSMTYPK